MKCYPHCLSARSHRRRRLMPKSAMTGKLTRRLRKTDPKHKNAVWPPPTRRLRYHALDMCISYGIAKGDGSLDRDAIPADKISLSRPEYKDWISVPNYGAERATWYKQRDEMVKAQQQTAEPMTAANNPFSRKVRVSVDLRAIILRLWFRVHLNSRRFI